MHACNWLKRVRSAAVVCFFERHIVELEVQLGMGDQRGSFQNIKLVQLEVTKKVKSRLRRRSNRKTSATRKGDVFEGDGCDCSARC